MESSRRAVESYWRSRMIDEATSDKDKVTAVYKLEEICELLRSSPAGIVKEVSEFILKRLDHKSPIVKQKALRVIKYAVGKSVTEFRREMQRHSVAVRQLVHYKGHPDPLKGDALNKAVRETAQDALSAIFSTDDIKPTPTENGHRRMEGFGNTNFSMPSEEKKSFISEVVGLGSATIKQGLSTLSQAHSFKKNETGSYRGPTLQRSLTNQIDYQDRYEKMEYTAPGSEGSSGISRNMASASGPWGQDSGYGRVEGTNGDSGAGHSQSKTREERLLETIVTSGGVRLQPTRDALQVFLGEAAKVDALALSYALESKLQSPLWQVRMKAICVLEAILRKKDDEQFLAIASYFNENIDVVVKCSESPQASLREKANKVLSLFGGGRPVAASEMSRMPEMTTPVQMPDLIDTGEPDDLLGAEESIKSQTDQNFTNQSTSTAPLIDDLFGDSFSSDVGTSELKTDDDPFSDVSFHTGENKEQGTNLFAGMTIGDNPADTFHVSKNLGADPFDVFGSNTELPPKQENHNNDVDNLMAGLSINENGSAKTQKASSSGTLPESVFSQLNTNPGSQALFDSVSAGIDSQKADVIPNSMFPMGAMPYAIPPGMIFNQSYPSQAINYAAMGGLLAQQQQFMAAMANFKPVGSLDSQHAGAGYLSGTDGGYVSPLPDIFNAKVPNQAANAMMNMPKKEETKAFDFISDHLAAARDPKRVL